MRWFAIGGLAGWSGIVTLAWWLADRRIELCGYGESGCALRATAARDGALTGGITVALISVLVLALLLGIPNRLRSRTKQSNHRVQNQESPYPQLPAREVSANKLRNRLAAFEVRWIGIIVIVFVLVAVTVFYAHLSGAGDKANSQWPGDPYSSIAAPVNNGAFDDLIPSKNTGQEIHSHSVTPPDAPPP